MVYQHVTCFFCGNLRPTNLLRVFWLFSTSSKADSFKSRPLCSKCLQPTIHHPHLVTFHSDDPAVPSASSSLHSIPLSPPSLITSPSYYHVIVIGLPIIIITNIECSFLFSYYAPISYTQMLKLMEKGGEFTYTSSTPPSCASLVGCKHEIEVDCNLF
jgi:hypothetical protein